MARKGYPAEFRWRALDLVAAGEPVAEVARLLEVSDRSIYRWWRQVARSADLASAQRFLCRLLRLAVSAAVGARGIQVGRNAVAMLMQRAGIAGRSGARKRYGIASVASAGDLVDRVFIRERPNQLWVTDISEHPTGEGKVFCAVVLDAFSRRVLGWSTNHNPTAALTSNALGMAIEQRDAQRGETVIHRDHGTQFTSSAFTERARQSGLLPSVGSVGDCYDTQLMMAPVALRFAV